MSVRNLINSFRSSISRLSTDARASDSQRRQWLRSALETLSASKCIENHTVQLSILNTDTQVILPRDYITADDQALVAVEYNFSFEFALSLGIDLDIYQYQPSRPIADYNRGLRYLQPLPKPRVTEVSLYGKTRMALQFHNSQQNARNEILVYFARWSVEDHRIEIALTSQPNANDTVAITVRKSSGDTTYTYTAITSTPSGNQFKIGQTKEATAINLSAIIVAGISTTGLTAEATGDVVSVFGASSEVDFTIIVDGVRLIAEEIPAYSNLDAAAQARIYKLMESAQYDYYCTEPGIELSDKLRDIYYTKAERLREEALSQFQTLTI